MKVFREPFAEDSHFFVLSVVVFNRVNIFITLVIFDKPINGKLYALSIGTLIVSLFLTEVGFPLFLVNLYFPTHPKIRSRNAQFLFSNLSASVRLENHWVLYLSDFPGFPPYSVWASSFS